MVVKVVGTVAMCPPPTIAEATSSGSAGESFGGALPGTMAAKFYQARQLLAESGQCQCWSGLECLLWFVHDLH